MSAINEKIKELRLRKGYTLLEVAEYLGVKEATVQRYESGNIKNIKYETICKLADLFKCDPCYIMGWSEKLSGNITNSTILQGNNANTLIVKNGSENQKQISSQAMELLRIFESLDIKSQTELLSLAYKLENQHNS